MKRHVFLPVSALSATALAASAFFSSAVSVWASPEAIAQADTQAKIGSAAKVEAAQSPGASKSSRPVKPLRAHADSVMVFNSNCPEVVLKPGILLSTFAPLGKDVPENHLGYAFKDDFGIFMHHINKQTKETADQTLFLNLIAHNSTHKPATLTLNEMATYCTRPDAPFFDRPALAEDADNKLVSGPGDKVCADFVHGSAAKDALNVEIGPGATAIVAQIPVSVKGLESALNGRSFYGLGHIQGALELANIATFGTEPPTLSMLNEMVQQSLMAKPREYEKLRPSQERSGSKGRFIYGRVCGVQRGSQLGRKIALVLRENKEINCSYPISSLPNGTFGTKDSQSLPLFRRYDDTAYSAHGNYCVRYKVTFSVRNDDKVERSIAVRFDSPVKSDKNEIVYLENGSKSMFYRGSVKLSSDSYERYFHVTLHKGEKLPPLDVFKLAPRETREIAIELFYPPDATPPQMLTISSKPQ
jgi:Protein of unknown function (DUF3370)